MCVPGGGKPGVSGCARNLAVERSPSPRTFWDKFLFISPCRFFGLFIAVGILGVCLSGGEERVADATRLSDGSTYVARLDAVTRNLPCAI